MKLLYITLISFLLFGCAKLVTPKLAAPKTLMGEAPVSSLLDETKIKTDELSSANIKRLSLLKSDISTASVANEKSTDAVSKEKISGDLGLAQASLADIPVDQERVAHNLNQHLLIEQGKVAEARANYQSEKEKSVELITRIAVLTKELADAQSKAKEAALKLEEEKKEFQRILSENNIRHQSEIQAVKLKYEGMAKRIQVLTFSGLGILLIAGYTLGAFIGGLVFAKKFWFLPAIGGLFLGLARVASGDFFLWLFYGALAITAVVGAYFLYRSHITSLDLAKTKTLANDLVSSIEEVKRTDESGALKVLLDQLNGIMDKDTKLLVENIVRDFKASKISQK